MLIDELKSARRADRDGEYWTRDDLERLDVLPDRTEQSVVRAKLSADSAAHFRSVGTEVRLSALAALMCTPSLDAVRYFAPRVNMPTELDYNVKVADLEGKHVVTLPLQGGSQSTTFGDTPYMDSGLMVMDSNGTFIYHPAIRVYSRIMVRDLSVLLRFGGCLFAHVTSKETSHGKPVIVFEEPQEDFRDTASRFVRDMNWGRVYTTDSLHTAMRQASR